MITDNAQSPCLYADQWKQLIRRRWCGTIPKNIGDSSRVSNTRIRLQGLQYICKTVFYTTAWSLVRLVDLSMVYRRDPSGTGLDLSFCVKKTRTIYITMSLFLAHETRDLNSNRFEFRRYIPIKRMERLPILLVDTLNVCQWDFAYFFYDPIIVVLNINILLNIVI